MFSQMAIHLRSGEELCGRIQIPMSRESSLKVKGIYTECPLTDHMDTPLIIASSLGLVSLVRGFIECAKEDTTFFQRDGRIRDFQDFLWHRNTRSTTAFDVAIEGGHLEVAKLLLENASLEYLMFRRNHEEKLPISMLRGSEHDMFILSTLERAISVAFDPLASTFIPIDHIVQLEPNAYTDVKMDPKSYPKSNIYERMRSLEKLDQGELELTPNKNTILHLVSKVGDVQYARDILQNHHSLLHSRNSEGETPAYIAAREGNVDILVLMIGHFKQNYNDIESILTRKDNHTALHIAIQNHHAAVVFWLVNAIPRLARLINNSKESPIYLAAESKYPHLLRLMLDKCEAKAFDGPEGKTALHAAAISGLPDCIKYLLHEGLDQYKLDDNGWTPLQYAVYHNNTLVTSELVDADPSIVYELMKEDNINTSAAHIAASRGYYETLKVLMSMCPGCSELLDGKEKNIFHVAVENKQIEVIEFIIQNESFTSLKDQKDNNGNTPIHLLMASDLETMKLIIMDSSRVHVNPINKEIVPSWDMPSSTESRMSWRKERMFNELDDKNGIRKESSVSCIQERMFNELDDKNGIRKESSVSSIQERMFNELDDKNWIRKESSVPSIQGISMTRIMHDNKNPTKISEEKYKLVENILLVATLIATATFAAAFTVPGGFDGNEGPKQGMPTLIRKAAFQAFMVTNTIAFSCSCSVLGSHIVLLVYRLKSDQVDDEREAEIDSRILGMYYLTGYALSCMIIAFATGIYVVLTPYLGLAIFLCVISLCISFYTLFFPTELGALAGMAIDLMWSLSRVLKRIKNM